MPKLIFSTNASVNLAKSLARSKKFRLAKAEVTRFADQEIAIALKERVKGREAYVIGATYPPGDNLLELLILIHTLKVNGAKKVNVIIPYFGYAKADRVHPAGTTFSSKLIVQTIEAAGATKVIVVDMHGHRVPKLFKIKYQGISAVPLLIKELEKTKIKNFTIAATDKGSIKRAEKYASALGIKKIVKVSKSRPGRDRAIVTDVSGEVKNMNVILADDMVQSGGTLCKTAAALKALGARGIYCAVTHILPTGPAFEILQKDKNITKVIFINTMPHPYKKLPPKFKQLKTEKLLLKDME
ncbi:MAG: hypothetical protein COT81_00210 [Candidatus Buchananbacteria bacterium CG10_big_fil_rev_8_21_14_0_10_42_9]|uniref:ribose-phosphate diphosphokinase n=1 Tax=Candidatus Buchananbacteria bacterium CG10_big_fil_rev_8_21_14_0_10_42_9 TaxID=1974526 RepID=A0A2H0W4Q9_9BACT|nr:MAG: hypothetical protein COT81_00210 [Candidatus Buchananbacteria bacterium CG10_big_fil_rev_8_21_14_0_10_42_9]